MSAVQVSRETIDTAIYTMMRGELRTEVVCRLRFGSRRLKYAPF
jgi:hypothetical protein